MKQKHHTHVSSLKFEIYHVLKQGIQIGGPIFFDQGLFMDAELEGTTLIGRTAESHFVLGPKGKLKADHLKGATVFIQGHANVEKVEADRLILTKGSSLRGNVVARSMEMAPGSKFEGTLSISGPPDPKIVSKWDRLKTFLNVLPAPSRKTDKDISVGSESSQTAKERLLCLKEEQKNGAKA